MNKENASQFLPLVQALADGKQIQVSRKDKSHWMNSDEPTFSSEYLWRIKPEPREFFLYRDDTSDDYYVSDTNPPAEWNELIKVREIPD